MGPLIEAIFAGNGIVIKGSEQTAWSAQYSVSVARTALRACGHDADLVQVQSTVFLSLFVRVSRAFPMLPNI
jgi:acyl-CoA reductase-like NAD-dependent aldehyde dehydrogenase